MKYQQIATASLKPVEKNASQRTCLKYIEILQQPFPIRLNLLCSKFGPESLIR